jgi:D-aminoacyl-tRNA deacylase
MVDEGPDVVLFVVSRGDAAGVNMANYLTSFLGYEEVGEDLYRLGGSEWYIFYVDEDIVYANNIEERVTLIPDTIIFLSRHSSISGTPSLSVHVTGNPCYSAEFGGSPFSLSNSHPLLMRSILIYMDDLNRERGLNYKVTLEVTHHGPSDVSKPSLFVEIGSTIEQWRDKNAVKLVVDSILKALDNPLYGVPTVGFGGPHYAPKFTKYLFQDRFAFGHILSKFVFEECLGDERLWIVINEAFEKTFNSNIAVIDWKGLKGEVRKHVYNTLVDFGYDVIKI